MILLKDPCRRLIPNIGLQLEDLGFLDQFLQLCRKMNTFALCIHRLKVVREIGRMIK